MMLHELTHNTLHSNDHLHRIFYETVNTQGAKLPILALSEPELFDPDAVALSEIEAVVVVAEEQHEHLQ